MVVVPAHVCAQYRRFSLFNSPYPAHDRGHAIDLYPDPGTAPSPVAGEVLDTRTVTAPAKPYATDHDHLILIAVDGDDASDSDADLVARILHVDPAVAAGDRVAVGDPLGETVRSGYFAPWVADHLHVGFRPTGANPYRASGSLPVSVGVDPEPVAWDGRGTVVESGDTYAVLDTPEHPAPGDRFVGVDCGAGVLDGGFPHYAGGGVHTPPGVADGGSTADSPDPELLGVRAGTRSGRYVDWADVTVRVDGTPVTGLSLFCTRVQFGVKLVCPELDLRRGQSVRVRVDPTR